MLLHLLRHAHAGNPDAWNGPDAARPLSEKGRAQADRLGRFLAERGFSTDALVTSPKLRAKETANIVGRHLGVPVREDGRLAGAVGLDTLEAILEDAGGPDRPVLVGHDPDFSELLGALCDAANIEMKKGALARIEVERPLEAGEGFLRWLVPPDLITPAR